MSVWPYTYEVLDVRDLAVDDSYQRPLTTFAGKIERGFDPALVGTLVVSRRSGGKVFVVDGQTRAAAISALVSSGALTQPGVPCLVYEGLSRADEASLFARLQKERRGIASYHRFRAAVIAGEAEAVAIQRIVERAGHQTGVGKDVISAVAALERVYRRGPEVLERTFAVLRGARGGEYVPSGDLLRGVGRLLDSTPDIDDRVLVERLKPWTPERLKRLALDVTEEAGAGGGGGGAEAYMAEAIEAVYHGYVNELGRPSRTCKARSCNATALRGSEYCTPHAEQAAKVLRRLAVVA